MDVLSVSFVGRVFPKEKKEVEVNVILVISDILQFAVDAQSKTEQQE